MNNELISNNLLKDIISNLVNVPESDSEVPNGSIIAYLKVQGNKSDCLKLELDRNYDLSVNVVSADSIPTNDDVMDRFSANKSAMDIIDSSITQQVGISAVVNVLNSIKRYYPNYYKALRYVKLVPSTNSELYATLSDDGTGFKIVYDPKMITELALKEFVLLASRSNMTGSDLISLVDDNVSAVQDYLITSASFLILHELYHIIYNHLDVTSSVSGVDQQGNNILMDSFINKSLMTNVFDNNTSVKKLLRLLNIKSFKCETGITDKYVINGLTNKASIAYNLLLKADANNIDQKCNDYINSLDGSNLRCIIVVDYDISAFSGSYKDYQKAIKVFTEIFTDPPTAASLSKSVDEMKEDSQQGNNQNRSSQGQGSTDDGTSNPSSPSNSSVSQSTDIPDTDTNSPTSTTTRQSNTDSSSNSNTDQETSSSSDYPKTSNDSRSSDNNQHDSSASADSPPLSSTSNKQALDDFLDSGNNDKLKKSSDSGNYNPNKKQSVTSSQTVGTTSTKDQLPNDNKTVSTINDSKFDDKDIDNLTDHQKAAINDITSEVDKQDTGGNKIDSSQLLTKSQQSTIDSMRSSVSRSDTSWRATLKKIISNAVGIEVNYVPYAPNARIEGQFGRDVLETKLGNVLLSFDMSSSMDVRKFKAALTYVESFSSMGYDFDKVALSYWGGSEFQVRPKRVPLRKLYRYALSKSPNNLGSTLGNSLIASMFGDKLKTFKPDLIIIFTDGEIWNTDDLDPKLMTKFKKYRKRMVWVLTPGGSKRWITSVDPTAKSRIVVMKDNNANKSKISF